MVPGSKTYLCGCGSALGVVWKLVSPWLNASVRDSIAFLPAGRMPQLLERLPAESVPAWCLEQSPALAAAVNEEARANAGSPNATMPPVGGEGPEAARGEERRWQQAEERQWQQAEERHARQGHQEGRAPAVDRTASGDSRQRKHGSGGGGLLDAGRADEGGGRPAPGTMTIRDLYRRLDGLRESERLVVAHKNATHRNSTGADPAPGARSGGDAGSELRAIAAEKGAVKKLLRARLQLQQPAARAARAAA
jgi:hypothetical protein